MTRTGATPSQQCTSRLIQNAWMQCYSSDLWFTSTKKRKQEYLTRCSPAISTVVVLMRKPMQKLLEQAVDSLTYTIESHGVLGVVLTYPQTPLPASSRAWQPMSWMTSLTRMQLLFREKEKTPKFKGCDFRRSKPCLGGNKTLKPFPDEIKRTWGSFLG